MITLRLTNPPARANLTATKPHRAEGVRGADRQPDPNATVFLIQEPTIPRNNAKVIDTSPLLWWGKVCVLMERMQTASFRPGPSLIQITKRLKDFQPDRDFIAVAGGDTLAILLTGSVLARMGFSHFYYLRFERARLPDGTRDPASGSYIPILVPLTLEGAAKGQPF